LILSVIVPAYNEERLLNGALTAIKSCAGVFTRKGWEVEFIVCDNNSTDRTAEIAREAGAKVVFEPINQIARARNTGARAARGHWLMFVDADSLPTQGLFADVLSAVESGKYLAGGVVLRMDTNHFLAGLIVKLWNTISRVFRLLAGSFIFVEAQSFRAVGGFDESLFASEEIDLSSRLKKFGRTQGKRLVILKTHPLNTSARKLHLYSFREHFRVIFRAVLTNKKSLRSREHCSTWYDGRR
jgi:glycosyltransferase involved in cell wall biosynthesis